MQQTSVCIQAWKGVLKQSTYRREQYERGSFSGFENEGFFNCKDTVEQDGDLEGNSVLCLLLTNALIGDLSESRMVFCGFISIACR